MKENPTAQAYINLTNLRFKELRCHVSDLVNIRRITTEKSDTINKAISDLENVIYNELYPESATTKSQRKLNPQASLRYSE